MKNEERDAFEEKYGYKPTEIRVAIDGLAVYVHKDNPLQGLTLAQVDAIFSKTRKRGYPKDIRVWGELGVNRRMGQQADQPLRPQLRFGDLWFL
ncbi:MAG: hypothetical protein KatS3mg115_2520 [Candidatus Poribacteria bacterium]|nr:MAG: hypothetical protein KatS3mg115_2520 [Candidatus Poribacteria bacterium]